MESENNVQDTQTKYRKLVHSLSHDYQNIYLINANSATVEIIKLNGHITHTLEDSEVKLYPYDRVMSNYITTRVLEADAAIVTEHMKLENIIRNAALEKCYEITYRVLTNGVEENYRAQYFDVNDGYIVCCLQNIDYQIEEEMKKNEDLHAIIDKMKGLNDELSEYINIISTAGYGIWHIILKDGTKPRMQVNEKMAELLGIESQYMTEEEIYGSWYNYITPDAIPSVQSSVQEMMDGKFSENTYKWEHPTKGTVYVRCGGTCIKLPDGTSILRGYHTDVTAIVKKEQRRREVLQDAKRSLEIQNQELTKQLGIINTISKVYYCMYYIDMTDYSITVLGENLPHLQDTILKSNNAVDAFEKMVNNYIIPDMRDNAREFLNIQTLNDRLRDTTWISCNLCEVFRGWFEGIFVVADRDADGNCSHVIFASKDIDDMKRREEQLIYSSNTDEMTHALNRRAYENAIKEYDKNGIPDDFIYISIDVNGLKVVNDTLGHEAGDEIIIGACQCMSKCFNRYGKLYRVGGDEFIALINTSKANLTKLKKKLDEITANWNGKLVNTLALSCGYVPRWEVKNLSMHQITVLADERMYEAKSQYYKSKGIDRRGQKDAYAGLSLVYDKILKINITKDSFHVINIGHVETMDDIHDISTISEWFAKFADSDLILADDVNTFLAQTDFDYIRKYFNDGRKRLPITYRKKYGDEYKNTVMEIIRANDYKPDNEIFFLYVKQLEE